MAVQSAPAALGQALFDALEQGVPLDPPTVTHPGLTVDDAYAAQQALVALHEAAGRRVVGHKIGLTSKAIQDQLGVDSPDFGVILDAFVFPSGSTIPRAGMCFPRIEGELAFRIGSDLGADADADAVLAATTEIVPVFELIDSRVRDWKITLPDTVADNASCWGVVEGTGMPVADVGPLADVTLELQRDDETVQSGTGAAVLGNPAEAVAWLARELAARGTTLRAGELVLSGSFTAAVDLDPGTYTANFGAGLEPVEVTIT